MTSISAAADGLCCKQVGSTDLVLPDIAAAAAPKAETETVGAKKTTALIEAQGAPGASAPGKNCHWAATIPRVAESALRQGLHARPQHSLLTDGAMAPVTNARYCAHERMSWPLLLEAIDAARLSTLFSSCLLIWHSTCVDMVLLACLPISPCTIPTRFYFSSP